MFCLHVHSSFIERPAKWIKFAAADRWRVLRVWKRAGELARAGPSGNERGLFHTIENTTIYLRRTADDDNGSCFGLQTEYTFHRRAPIDTLCDTNNKAAKLIARNIFFAKARDTDGRSWKELLQQISRRFPSYLSRQG